MQTTVAPRQHSSIESAQEIGKKVEDCDPFVGYAQDEIIPTEEVE
jgi:hypothetical protein